ncbi:hypothetical protein CAOG_007550 [Capsaspora owczarzaki ATCC 30864]|uniref:Uncharacterized protein n=1 Tax=Capsaspora owczarzaki (strain ATCC 30864) TaxID=595528 RepID=A0A0D2X527_CAPO3|nr:hypothetical protein CAOG_007550 [Capsaspora owczarzaki ATCC 30864]
MVHVARKIGIGLTGFGIFFLLLGILMLFDTGLLAMGNLLFLSGVGLLIGWDRTIRFFFQRHKAKGTTCFLGGIFVVLCGWPVIGMCVEIFGFINLFGDFFPIVINFLRQMPVVGQLLNLPGIAQVVDKFTGSKLPV